VIGIAVQLRVFLAGDAPDEPCIDPKPIMQLLENASSVCVFRLPPTCSKDNRTGIELQKKLWAKGSEARHA
jgi:hypothetical protein